MVGSFGKLYGSVDDMSPTYIVSNDNKNNLLHNRLPTDSPVLNETFLLQQDPSPISPANDYYMCPNYGQNTYVSSKGRHITCNNQYVTTCHGKPCSCCGCAMSNEVKFEEGTIAKSRASVGKRGYVKGVVTYMVMDDLVVSPMSAISSISLFSTSLMFKMLVLLKRRLWRWAWIRV